ncbi:MAG: Protein of unknown function transrane [Gemmatimonadetes bacterium]|nr:Protein of unknown function transrane [Gemmatimonadota bacterium]
MSSRGDVPVPREDAGAEERSASARLTALEAQMEALRSEVGALRQSMQATALPVNAAPAGPPGAGRFRSLRPSLVAALRQPPPDTGSASSSGASAPSPRASADISAKDLESLVGRYGTLALAALVILMAVGALIKMAIEKGMLTPEVRVLAGALAACATAGAGMYFRRRGDIRYGNVLLAISLAIVDLVAWGAGPRLHLVPVTLALAVVDAVALALAALALMDESEFLFSIALVGALSAPFVTSDNGGTALMLLLYGGTVLASSLRAARHPDWMGAFGILFVGALFYAIAAAELPMSAAWYGPHLVTLFAAACAAAALLAAEPRWQSELSRAYIVIAVIGPLTAWKATGPIDSRVTIASAVLVAGITHAALLGRGDRARLWVESALLLPGISLAVAYAATIREWEGASVLALWAVFSFVAWRVENARGELERGGVHLLAASVLGAFAIARLLWPEPLALVAGLAGWSVVISFLCKDETSTYPLLGVGLSVAGAVASALDQLASRAAYSYTPLMTRSSASALCAALGIAVSGMVLESGKGAAGDVVDRPVRLGVLIGFLIVWGRMELANAFTPDLASFLLTSYYAACGVASIVAGRRLGIGRLRVAGLALALFAAFKAIVEVTDISSVLLRVAAYGAVGVFLLGAGYLYRENVRGGERTASMG